MSKDDTRFAEGDRVVRLSDERSGTVEGSDESGDASLSVEMDHGEHAEEPAGNFRLETEDDRSQRGMG